MINLIPATVKRSVVIEYWVRVVSIWLIIISVSCLMFAAFSLPVYVLVSAQADTYAKSAQEAADKAAGYDLSAGTLVKTNLRSQKIYDLGQAKEISAVLGTLESFQGNGVAISSYEFSRDGKSLAPVSITGIAKTRQTLVNFRDSLEKLPEVANVHLPITNLAKDKDIRFSITITLNPGV